MKERIQKLLARAGVASRRAVEQMVEEGRVQVNGKTVRRLPVMVDPVEDKILVDGERVQPKAQETSKRWTFILNKPKGVYSTNVAQGVQLRAVDLLPPHLRARLFPIGRLDAESRGLLLLTNDGDLAHRLTHPRFGVPKTYRAVIDGAPRPEELEKIENGVWLSDKAGRGKKSGKVKIRIVRRANDRSVLEIILREGRNDMIRRLLAKLGHKVRQLVRVSFGPLKLEGLGVGQCRELTPRELRSLKRFGEHDRAAKPAPPADDDD